MLAVIANYCFCAYILNEKMAVMVIIYVNLHIQYGYMPTCFEKTLVNK